MKLAMPDGLAETAQSLGVEITPTLEIDPVDAIGSLRSQFGADVFADCFGCMGGDDDAFGWDDPETQELEINYELAAELIDVFGHDAVDIVGQDAFGFGLPKMFRKIVKKTVIKPLAAKAKTPQQKALVAALAKAPLKVNVKKSIVGLGKGIGTGVAIASFVVPGAGPLIGGAGLAALGAADKLLSDPRVKNAAQVVKNTRALAALGDVPAQRGAAALATVAQIRKTKAVPPGKAAIPLTTTAQRAAVAAMVPKTVQKTTPAQLKVLASTAVIKKPGLWARVLAAFGLKRAA